MTDTSTRTQATQAAERAPTTKSYPEPTGWVGWNIFAGTMMLIAGAFQATDGLIAVINDQWVVWGNRGSLYLDLTTWGWVHIGIGTVVFIAGLGVFTGNLLARIVAVAVAVVSLIANFMFLPAYPIWGLTIIAVDLLVIWALTAHGAEMKGLSRQRDEIDLRQPAPQ